MRDEYTEKRMRLDCEAMKEVGKSVEKKYEVGVSRSYSHTGSVIVTAESPERAEELAMEQINDTELKLGELVPGTDEVLYVEEV